VKDNLIMYVRPVLGRGGVYSLVGQCPICGKWHTHGGGTDGENLILGHRCSHCTTGNGGDYELRLEGGYK